MSKSVLLCLCLFGMTPSVLARPNRQLGKCGALKYKVAETYTRTNDLAAMAISINPKDVTNAKSFDACMSTPGGLSR
jgi:hypothetical protein